MSTAKPRTFNYTHFATLPSEESAVSLYVKENLSLEGVAKLKEFKVMGKQYLYTNRLINQKSPYLLQHAHNPVDWYPWDSEAFALARQNGKPIFLSIGYATCHWCHVMEKECFEDPQIAELMNEAFVNIKVDREELPEIDGLYMEFAQTMMAGAAGWPLNLILTPDLHPFFAATYLPPKNSRGLVGMKELIARIKDVWGSEEREAIEMQASKIVQVLSEGVHAKGEEIAPKELIEDTANLLFKMADSVYGGMQGAPKFPVGYQISFMLRYFRSEKDSRALFLVERTLDMMQRGGIYDHLGGGFSRYTVDAKWLIPHFEKMLYDNAILSQSYLEAWQMTKFHFYHQICEEILWYVLRDMSNAEGGFFSAEDADSEGHEGLFYTWTPEEVKQALTPNDCELFCSFYGITPTGNFEGRSVINTRFRINDFCEELSLDPKIIEPILEEQKRLLWNAREKREHPFKDDKIITSWNGLMIHSLTSAGCAFGEPIYLNAALKAAKFIRTNLWINGHLLRRWREGNASFAGGLDEYAFMIRGILSLFEAGYGVEWLSWAIEMSEILKKEYKAESGAFYQTDGSDPHIILRKCQFADGAEPSGNAIHCENLLRLYEITQNLDYLEQAEDILKAMTEYAENHPLGYCQHMINLNHYYERHVPIIVIALNKKREFYEELRLLLYQDFIPYRAIIWKSPDDLQLLALAPFIKEQGVIEDKTTLYICYEGVCKKPILNYSEMAEALRKL